jgi:FkbM family methyltransferase
MLGSITQNRRLRTLASAVLQRRSDTSYKHLLYNVFCPTSGVLAKRAIAREERSGEFILIYLAGRANPLYFPAAVDRCFLNQAIAEAIPSAWHCYETPETMVRPDDVVMDCGAAEGLFSFNIAERCRKVVCFEPLPVFARALERTFAPYSHVIVEAKAVGDRSGTAYLSENAMMTRVTQEASGQAVEVQSIDSYCVETGTRPTYLKADLEGYEMKMLEGARNTIRELKPRIAITTYHRPGDARAILDFLRGLNPAYRFKLRGMEYRTGEPMLLHAW